jgi:hypothetical protein
MQHSSVTCCTRRHHFLLSCGTPCLEEGNNCFKVEATLMQRPFLTIVKKPPSKNKSMCLTMSEWFLMCVRNAPQPMTWSPTSCSMMMSQLCVTTMDCNSLNKDACRKFK